LGAVILGEREGLFLISKGGRVVKRDPKRIPLLEKRDGVGKLLKSKPSFLFSTKVT
jgi:hypothetical protein